MQQNSRSFQKFKKVPLISSIIFLILSSSALVLVYKQIENNKKISALAHAEWQAEALRRDEVKSLERLIKAMEQERMALESHFAYSSNIVPFLDSIEQLAIKAGAKSEVASVDVLKDQSGMMVEIKTTGSFEAIYKFLVLLENSSYELEFMLIDMQQISKESGWEASFRIKLLSFLQ